MKFSEGRLNEGGDGQLQAPAASHNSSLEKKSPRPHQKEAVKDLVSALGVSGSDVRTQGHMACGTGKTMVALWVAEKLKAQNTLLAEPSLALIAQNLKEWQVNARGARPEILVVCSDQTVVKPNHDEVRVDVRDIPARVTNDPEEIAQFLKNKSERKILMSTYHSLPLLGRAMETKGTGRFDIAVADEAHRTAAKEEGAFTLFHYQEAIRSRARLYLTATPKIYEGDSEVKISMDDETIFGKVGHSLPFSKAIEKGLLTDYRLVVATLPENYGGLQGTHSSKETRDAVAQLAVLKAIEKYHLSKVLSFHSSVARAYEFAQSLEITGPKYLKDRSIWVHGVDGTMPSSTRANLLKLLAERPKKAISLISNCRCLTEGIDVPAIDGVVFFDPKKDGIDIVQAIGRAIRQSTSTNKQFGTIVVPLVVPENVESAEFLESSEFRKIAQVMRALRAHDDRFEIRLRDILSDWNVKEASRTFSVSSPIHFNLENLPDLLKNKLSTKILKVGANVRGSPLNEDAIRRSALLYKDKFDRWPNRNSTEDVPEMPGESWAGIDYAGKLGYRTLREGRTLAKIISTLIESRLKEKTILAAARLHRKEFGVWPTRDSIEKVPGMPEETWRSIDDAGKEGRRGLKKGRTLAEILNVIGGELHEDLIRKAATLFKDKYKKWPTSDSLEEVPGMPGETWGAINAAGKLGGRGLEKGRTLSKILEDLKTPGEKRGGLLSENSIRISARLFKEKYHKWPTKDSKEEVPGMPGETWKKIQSAAYAGIRGLTKGSSIAKIIAPLKEELSD